MSDQLQVIPPMTHPLSHYWDQPDPSQVLIDDKHALMTKEVFDALKDYSLSQPSGVYEGKMWKGCGGGTWYLRWYGPTDDPDYVSNNQREIILIG